MRRSLVAIAVLAAVGSLAVRQWSAGAQALQGPQSPTAATQAGTCALTNYTLSGPFSRLCGGTAFTIGFSGGCVGGVALGAGNFQPSNGAFEVVAESLVNTGGEYVIEMHTPALTATAIGNITTLPIPCELGQTQTTISGTGTLTYGTTS